MVHIDSVAQTSKRFATVAQMSTIYPAFKTSSIRQLIFYSKTNGFDDCVKRVGKKILIDLDKFEDWIDRQL